MILLEIEKKTIAPTLNSPVTESSKEIGGVLVGTRDRKRIFIKALLEVPDALATKTSYFRSHAKAEMLLKNLIKEPGKEKWIYLGEWHTHLGSSGISEQDLAEIKDLNMLSLEPLFLIIFDLNAKKMLFAYPSTKIRIIQTPEREL